MIVSEYMTHDVVTANLQDGLHQTFHRMMERNVRHMPVLDDDGNLAGLVSERDLRRPAYLDTDNTTRYYALDNSTKVVDAMSRSPETLAHDAPISQALDALISKKYGAIPVVDDAGKLVGILSSIDMLRAFRDSL